jgi:hypothetical protein
MIRVELETGSAQNLAILYGGKSGVGCAGTNRNEGRSLHAVGHRWIERPLYGSAVQARFSCGNRPALARIGHLAKGLASI